MVLDIFLWKLPLDWSFVDENGISCNNETIEICTNDVIMEEKDLKIILLCTLKQIKIKRMKLNN